ncbi:hypothetical protein DF185_16860 [Marinifilum breve]|uniref:Lipoprotein n=1 Tax=Marinifilum breve TaxID=2184082 RepID=A0A2V3ZUB9_9BACT|nr:hypothetical protein [Marinifilum breve]PXX98002.1 hypothetical protein DF185_16860 [Marinifilum breve]
MRTLILNIILVMLFSGCATKNQSSKKMTKNQQSTYQQVAKEKYGEEVEFKFNLDKKYVICEKMNSKLQPNPNQLKEFFVYDITKGAIIYEDKIANAKVEWHNEKQLLITKQRGYITNPEDTGKWAYVFDLITKKKITDIREKN